MGKTVYFINGVFGIGVGVIDIIITTFLIITNFSLNLIGWLIGGIICLAFGIFQWKLSLLSIFLK